MALEAQASQLGIDITSITIEEATEEAARIAAEAALEDTNAILQTANDDLAVALATLTASVTDLAADDAVNAAAASNGNSLPAIYCELDLSNYIDSSGILLESVGGAFIGLTVERGGDANGGGDAPYNLTLVSGEPIDFYSAMGYWAYPVTRVGSSLRTQVNGDQVPYVWYNTSTGSGSPISWTLV